MHWVREPSLPGGGGCEKEPLLCSVLVTYQDTPPQRLATLLCRASRRPLLAVYPTAVQRVLCTRPLGPAGVRRQAALAVWKVPRGCRHLRAVPFQAGAPLTRSALQVIPWRHGPFHCAPATCAVSLLGAATAPPVWLLLVATHTTRTLPGMHAWSGADNLHHAFGLAWCLANNAGLASGAMNSFPLVLSPK